jgi:hypothetical protein
MSVTELVLKHVATVRVPEEAKIVRELVAEWAWRIRGDALAEAGNHEEAERAYAHGPRRPGITQNDIDRARELSEKYGLQRLLDPEP